MGDVVDSAEAERPAETGSVELSPADRARLKALRAQGLVIAFLVFVCDQAIKWTVTYPLNLRGQPDWTIRITDFFNLRWVENNGVSLGLLSASSFWGRWLLVLLTGAIAVFVTFWLWRERKRTDSIALAMVLGGAFGNILDRIRLGYVVDFADLHFGEFRPFLVFNVADAAITIGVLLLLVRALLMRDGKAPKKEVDHA
ncbi:signal peptidase II [Allosphingosinicella sp.]|uniref:signal peptidase II n=1 Tax=Allosphingosinicella sp. TaxID=2823234 RepID=UPI003782F2E1